MSRVIPRPETANGSDRHSMLKPMNEPPLPAAVQRKIRRLGGATVLLAVVGTVAPVWWARSLDFELWGWPVYYWLVAQGSVLLYLVLIVTHATLVNRWIRQARQREA